MNFEQARFNMVEQQIRPWDVLDDNVLRLINELPRDQFVPATERRLAYADIEIPLNHGQCMMAPKIEARLLQSLTVKESDSVLEIGTGSGYLTALLARLAKHVYSIDIFDDFIRDARSKLSAAGITNVTLQTGDGANGWAAHGPYDAIAATASYPTLPQKLLNQLKIGGRLFVVVGNEPVMEALLITRTGEQAWSRESLFETTLPRMHNVQEPSKFVF